MGVSQIQVELQEWMGSDEAIANAAWTSTYDKTKREGKYDDPDKVADIVRRCVKDGHSVPLESVVLRFWCRWPVFVDRQHLTHRMASHNGLSARYRTVPDDFYEMPEDVIRICAKAKDPESLSPAHCGRTTSAAYAYASMCAKAYDTYKDWLDDLRDAEKAGRITNGEYKRARELLRAVIPTAFMVERTTILNLGSFANYQRLRNSAHAQPEIREAAEKMLSAVVRAKVAPVALGALMDVGWTLQQPNHNWSESEH